MTIETHLDGGHCRRTQRVRVKPGGWTKARRTKFLRTLAETCNVKLSSEAVGVGPSSVYCLRKRDPAFARLWDEALDVGYDRLETLLLQRALEGVNAIDVAALVDAEPAQPAESADPIAAGPGGGAPATPPRERRLPGAGIPAGLARGDVQLALALLNRRSAQAGLRNKGGRRSMTEDEVDALLTKKLDALARRADRTA